MYTNNLLLDINVITRSGKYVFWMSTVHWSWSIQDVYIGTFCGLSVKTWNHNKYLHHCLFIVLTALLRLAGYYLYVSNSSISKTDGHLCYHDEGTVPTSAYTDVNCNYLGNRVIFYNKRDKDNIPSGYSDIAIVELCHIEVYGK